MGTRTYIPYVVAAFFSLFALAFLDNARGPFFPDITQSLGLSDSAASLFFVATSFFSFLLGRNTPRLLRHVHLVNLVRIALVIMFAGFLSMGFAQSLLTLCLASALFGVGYGIINVTQNLMIIEGTTLQKRRRLLSGLQSMYALSSLVAPALIGVMIAHGIGWRYAVFLFSVIPIIALVSTFWAQPQPVTEPVHVDHVTSMGWPTFLVATMIGFYVIGELMISTRVVLYLRRFENYDPETAAHYLALFFLCMFLGRIFFTFFTFERWTSRQIMLASLFFGFICYLMGFFQSPVWLIVAGFPLSPFFALSVNYMAETFSRRSHEVLASALAIQALYIVAMHYIMGWVTEMWSIRAAMLISPLFLLISFGLLILEPWKKHAQPVPAD